MNDTDSSRLPQAPKKSVFYKIGSVVRTVLGWLGRGWKAVSYSIGSLILFFLVIGLISGIALPSGGQFGDNRVTEKVVEGEGPDKIAVVRLSGMILTEAAPISPLSGGVSDITPGRVGRFLDQAARDEDVKGVVLFVNSPGGSAVASDMIFERIQEFKSETKKPVVVSMGDTVASGGYYISAAADRIVANEATITGSIGVIARLYNLSELYSKIGVKSETFKKGEFKDIFSEARDRTEEEQQMIDGILNDAYEMFLAKVAEGRSGATDQQWTVEDVRQVAEGRIYSGVSARDAGLVDEIGNLSTAIDMTKSLSGTEKAQVVEYRGGSVLEQLFGGVSLNVLSRLSVPVLDPTPRVMFLLDY